MPRAVLLMGPTASGKSLLAMRLAQVLPVEIVSVDSAQIYSGMDIGTAKPSSEERSAVPHHLVDIMPPTEAYSAARFREDALRLVEQICSRGRIPLLVGGTMLYFRALREGLSKLPQADADTRAQIDREAAKRGWPAMHSELARVDPDIARRLKPNDSQRIQRALEVFRLSGEALSSLQQKKAGAEAPFPAVAIGLVASERSRLHERIASRFSRMLSHGLIDELRKLRTLHALRPELPSMRTVGYRQAWQHLEGEFDRDELERRGIYATRQLAKRQLTWLRGMQDTQLIDCFDENLQARVLDLIEQSQRA